MKKTYILIAIGILVAATYVGSATFSYAPMDDVAAGNESVTNRTWSVDKIYDQIHLTNGMGATELASTAVTAGSYTNSSITVDEDGRITSASNGSTAALLSGTNAFTGANTVGDGGDLIKIHNMIPTTNGDWSGECITVEAGENLALGDLVYITSSTGVTCPDVVYKTDADASTTMPGVYLVLETINNGSTGKALRSGMVHVDAWTWTRGQIIYASTDSGALTATAPSAAGDQVQIIGIAKDPDTLDFRPDLTVVELGGS